MLTKNLAHTIKTLNFYTHPKYKFLKKTFYTYPNQKFLKNIFTFILKKSLKKLVKIVLDIHLEKIACMRRKILILQLLCEIKKTHQS